MVAPLVVLTLILVAVPPTEPAKRKPAPATGGWVVSKSVSKMDDSQTVVLKLQASSPISGWPAKRVMPTLLLRCQEAEVSAFVNVGMRANVEAENLEGATVVVRFDKEPAKEFKLGHSTDGEALFFQDAEAVIFRMMRHETMLFRFTPFNSSPQETSFNLRGLRAVIKPLETACDWDPDQEARAEEKEAKEAKDGRKAREVPPAELELIKERTTRLLDQRLPESRRLTAAHDLGRMRTPNVRLVLPSLVQALSDPSDAIKMAAVEALGDLGPGAADAMPALESVRNLSTNATLTTLVSEALQKIRP
jgi:type VI secretion system protein VasI